MLPVLAVLDPSVDYRNPEHVARRVGRIPAGVDAVFENVRVSCAVEPEAEVDVGVRGVVVAMAEARHPQRIKLADPEFDVAVSAQLFLRRRTGILTSVTTRCFLDTGFRDHGIHQVAPGD